MRGSSGGAGSLRAHPVLLPFSDDAQDPDIYRRVFISLRLPDTSRCRSIGLTSAVRGEGRTTLARGFALTLAADLEVPVWLAELDLEHPSLADYFGLPPAPGLCDVLRGGLELEDVAFPVAENLSVLPAGAVQREAPRLLRQLGNEDPFARPGMPQRMVVFDPARGRLQLRSARRRAGRRAGAGDPGRHHPRCAGAYRAAAAGGIAAAGHDPQRIPQRATPAKRKYRRGRAWRWSPD